MRKTDPFQEDAMTPAKKVFVLAFMILSAASAAMSAQDAAVPAAKALTVAEVMAAARADERPPLIGPGAREIL